MMFEAERCVELSTGPDCAVSSSVVEIMLDYI